MSNELIPINYSQQLTTNFYLWENRGRGWQVWGCPVELEPPFVPFFHMIAPPSTTKQIDDGFSHSIPSLLVEKAKNSLFSFLKKEEPKAEEMPYATEDYYNVAPAPFFDESRICEMQITLPSNQKINFENTEHFLLSLSYCLFPISFEIIGTSNNILLNIACRWPDLQQVKQQIKAYFHEAVISESGTPLSELWNANKEHIIVDFGLSEEFMRPLRTFKSFEPDPLISIIGAMENICPRELGVLQVLFQPVRNPWTQSIVRSVTDWEGKSFFADSPEMVSLAKEKIRKPLYSVIIRIAVQSDRSNRVWDIARGLSSALSIISYPQSNELIPLTNDDYDNREHQRDLLMRQSQRSGMLFNSDELISLVHFPSASVQSVKFRGNTKKTKEVPSIAIGNGIILGRNEHQGKESTVTLSNEQRLRHTYIIGATGTGKSTLLHNMICQDIKSGSGVAVLDPHGDLIDNILAHIPESRFDDVILFDPSDSDYPVGINILSANTDIEKNVLSSDLVEAFKRLSTSWGDQMTSVLGNAIHAFLESDDGGTLIDLRRFLLEKPFRQKFLESVNDAEIVYYWEKAFPLLSGKPMGSIITRLDTFLRPKLIRNMVAQKEGINFHDILNNKKILLCKLAQGLIGEENAYLLGALIVSKIHQTVMARQSISQSERNLFFCYIDEFHNFISPSMASILSGARKYNLGLILAHQELRQLWNKDTEVANSVISNPGTRICFRLGDFDAQKLKDGFSYFNDKDLQNLSTGEAIVRIDRSDFDFNLKTILPEKVSSLVAADKQQKLIESSRQKYSTQKENIEKILSQNRELEQVEEVKEKSKKAEKPKESIKAKEPVKFEDVVIKKEESKPPPVEVIKNEDVKLPEPYLEGKGGHQHRALQNLIKRMAEGYGYKSVIEKATDNNEGFVDVSLEKDGKRIACEISMTTSEAHEIKNIEKCLIAGYDKVILCSPNKTILEKVKKLVIENTILSGKEKVLFLLPDELYFYLESEAAKSASKVKTVKGYRVKVNYNPVNEADKNLKQESIAKAVLDSMRRG